MAALVEFPTNGGDRTPPPARGALDERLRSLHRDANRFTNDLIVARARFGGDLDRLLIVLVFLLARIESMQRGSRGGCIEGLNALSIADVTGLPRETARRKLIAMVDNGDLMRGPGGLYSARENLEGLIEDLRPLIGVRPDA